MTGDEVRAKVFQQRLRGYHVGDVNNLLVQIADELDAGRSPAALIEQARFPLTLGGYDLEALDQFLEQLQRGDIWPRAGDPSEPRFGGADVRGDTELNEGSRRWSGGRHRGDRASSRSRREARKRLAAERAAAWQRFPDLPGTHIRFQRIGWGRYDIVTGNGDVIATVNDWSGSPFARRIWLRSVNIGGQIYTVRRIREAGQRVVVLMDASTVPLLRVTGRHFGWQAKAIVRLSAQRSFRFPVEAIGPKDALMKAVDESGSMVFQLRRARVPAKRGRAGGIDVVVEPGHQLTTEIVLLIAIASGLLVTYFNNSGGG